MVTTKSTYYIDYFLLCLTECFGVTEKKLRKNVAYFIITSSKTRPNSMLFRTLKMRTN